MKTSVYFPDELHSEVAELIGENGNLSRFLQQLVDEYLEPLRPRCVCGFGLNRHWRFCPSCGQAAVSAPEPEEADS